MRAMLTRRFLSMPNPGLVFAHRIDLHPILGIMRGCVWGSVVAISEKGFSLRFTSVEGFRSAMTEHGVLGYFFRTDQEVALGQSVRIRIELKEAPKPFHLEGMVAWRRVKTSKDLQAGLFVQLSDHERERFFRIVDYYRRDIRGHKQRKHERFQVRWPVTYQTADGQYKAQTDNISQKGAFLRCKGPVLPEGSEFPIILSLDDANDQIKLMVQVAWINGFDTIRGMGVRFKNRQAGLRKVRKTLARIAQMSL